jgi:hypothetical protein
VVAQGLWMVLQMRLVSALRPLPLGLAQDLMLDSLLCQLVVEYGEHDKQQQQGHGDQ